MKIMGPSDKHISLQSMVSSMSQYNIVSFLHNCSLFHNWADDTVMYCMHYKCCYHLSEIMNKSCL